MAMFGLSETAGASYQSGNVGELCHNIMSVCQSVHSREHMWKPLTVLAILTKHVCSSKVPWGEHVES